eukprot:scaffold527_cov368-Prasinococcus_capsulatus_cf.AAC.34
MVLQSSSLDTANLRAAAELVSERPKAPAGAWEPWQRGAGVQQQGPRSPLCCPRSPPSLFESCYDPWRPEPTRQHIAVGSRAGSTGPHQSRR